MKEKTSITLSTDVLSGIDRLAGSKHSRSAFIEGVLRRYLRERARQAVEARDLEKINTAAERLNSEAADVMEYQSIEGQASEQGRALVRERE
jgi:metal-responsive CopG/Arc/MetJ family transcriptional regulator